MNKNYWKLVENSLVEVHEFTERESKKCVKRYHRRLNENESLISIAEKDLPENVSVRLAGKKIKELNVANVTQ